jgi:hypothetical protein
VVFNANKDENQALIIRPAGIEPGSENDIHIIEAETNKTVYIRTVSTQLLFRFGTFDLLSGLFGLGRKLSV